MICTSIRNLWPFWCNILALQYLILLLRDLLCHLFFCFSKLLKLLFQLGLLSSFFYWLDHIFWLLQLHLSYWNSLRFSLRNRLFSYRLSFLDRITFCFFCKRWSVNNFLFIFTKRIIFWLLTLVILFALFFVLKFWGLWYITFARRDFWDKNLSFRIIDLFFGLNRLTNYLLFSWLDLFCFEILPKLYLRNWCFQRWLVVYRLLDCNLCGFLIFDWSYFGFGRCWWWARCFSSVIGWWHGFGERSTLSKKYGFISKLFWLAWFYVLDIRDPCSASILP